MPLAETLNVTFAPGTADWLSGCCTIVGLNSTVSVAGALGTVGDSVDVSAVFDGWGYVHLYRNGSGKLRELDTYAIPQAHDPAHASGYGALLSVVGERDTAVGLFVSPWQEQASSASMARCWIDRTCCGPNGS